jgi:hypothetical protein
MEASRLRKCTPTAMVTMKNTARRKILENKKPQPSLKIFLRAAGPDKPEPAVSLLNKKREPLFLKGALFEFSACFYPSR